MKGQKIKDDLRDRGVSASSIAQKLGMTQQNFSAILQGEDIKTGFLEKVSEALGVSPAYFYTGESSGSAVVGTANQSTVIGKQDGGTRALERQLEVKDGQIDRLLKIIESLNGI